MDHIPLDETDAKSDVGSFLKNCCRVSMDQCKGIWIRQIVCGGRGGCGAVWEKRVMKGLTPQIIGHSGWELIRYDPRAAGEKYGHGSTTDSMSYRDLVLSHRELEDGIKIIMNHLGIGEEE